MTISRRGRVWAGLLLLAAWGSASAAETSWTPVEGQREWVFPDDHGAHPAYRTEWWYVTGLLQDSRGGRHGYQITLFRSGLRKAGGRSRNPWAVGDVYAGHFALTGITAGQFTYAERISREGPGLAGSSPSSLNTWLLDWSMESRGSAVHLHGRDGNMEVELILNATGPPVLHGTDGLSRKGAAPGQASWYYSLPAMESRGILSAPWTDGPMKVSGTSWFDHEFGSNQLSPDQEGWDWFSLHIEDGSALMIYLLRRSDGTVESASSGTMVYPDRTWRHLDRDTFSVEVLERWKSSRSGAVYPSRWQIEVPQEGIELEIEALVAEQELLTPSSTGVTYWEGAVSGRGRAGGRTVRAEGYVELTGYAGSLGGLF